MIENPAGKKERFQILLRQLELLDDRFYEHFKYGEIEKLVVERQSRRWHFYFLLEKILPFEVYLTFTTRLRQAFQHIADVRFSIRAKDPSFEAGTDCRLLENLPWRTGRHVADAFVPACGSGSVTFRQ